MNDRIIIDIDRDQNMLIFHKEGSDLDLKISQITLSMKGISNFIEKFLFDVANDDLDKYKNLESSNDKSE